MFCLNGSNGGRERRCVGQVKLDVLGRSACGGEGGECGVNFLSGESGAGCAVYVGGLDLLAGGDSLLGQGGAEGPKVLRGLDALWPGAERGPACEQKRATGAAGEFNSAGSCNAARATGDEPNGGGGVYGGRGRCQRWRDVGFAGLSIGCHQPVGRGS